MFFKLYFKKRVTQGAPKQTFPAPPLSLAHGKGEKETYVYVKSRDKYSQEKVDKVTLLTIQICFLKLFHKAELTNHVNLYYFKLLI